MITTIGDGCFLQNWLYMKSKELNTFECGENLLSRIKSLDSKDYNKSIILEKLERYDDFCQNFIKTGKKDKVVFLSKEENAKIHMPKYRNLTKQYLNLKFAKVVLYWARFQKTHEEALANIDAVYNNLRKVSRAKFIAFTSLAKNTNVDGKYQIVYFPSNEVKYIDTTDDAQYVPHWIVSDKCKNILENSFEKILYLDKKA